VSSVSSATDDRTAQRAPEDGKIRAQLEHVLASPALQASERRRAFLRYVVEETLAGRADRLKGYSVAIAVFGRNDDFDAQADPVVRLEARRLRRDLDSYYVEAGSRDPVRISIPKGSYVPRFDWHQPGPAPLEDVAPRPETAPLQAPTAAEPSGPSTSGTIGPPPARTGIASALGRSRTLILGLVLLLVVVAIAGFKLLGDQAEPTAGPIDEPAIVVLPFRALGDSSDGRYLAAGISEALIGDLLRFPGFRLYALPASEDSAPPSPVTLAQDAGVTYVVSGSVTAAGDEVRVAAQMLDASTSEVLWSSMYDRPFTPDALIRTQNAIAGDIATVLGQPYGVVGNDLGGRIATPQVANMQSYVCVLRAYAYRRGFARAEFDPVLSCLERAVQRDPEYSDAWAMLGWLHLDAGRFGYAGHDDTAAEYAKGLAAAERALAIEPDNPLALKAAASINHYMGKYDEGERLARRAVELNPNDPDALAQLGWRLAVRGKFDEGIPILRQAIERTINPPGWYFHLVAIDQYLRGDYRAMLEAAERSASDGSGVSQALIAIAAGELGDSERARASLERMGRSGLIAMDPAAYLRRHGATDQIVDALMQGLAEARQVAAN